MNSRNDWPAQFLWWTIAVQLAQIALLVLSRSPVHAVETWADSQLTTVDGLELWLDAGRVAGDRPAEEGAAVNVWRDASGKRRDLSSQDAPSSPTLFKADQAALVRFDGIDDCLRATHQATHLRSFTIVVIAAPRLNMGSFRGLLATSAAGERDYTSGVAVDLGPWGTADFSTLNVEGRGFSGARSLRTKASPLGRLETILVASDADLGTVQLFINGEAEGERPRDGQPVSLDEITVGARHYSHDAGPQRPTGHLRADLAEILIYNRVLTPAETSAIHEYASAKYAALRDALPPIEAPQGELLQTVGDPPAVQMFAPGFAVRELPIELPNVNNVKYRADGALVAMAYDGNIWLLRDTDGDGLEDKAEPFWTNDIGLRSPIGMDLTPPGYAHGQGLFVVGKTQCLLIVDADGDDRADKVLPIAEGWKESFHQVDGLGVAFDKRDGSVYYGRGTYNFADPLLKDKDGKPQFRLTDESGAILRVSPDFQRREIVATGIRFPVALRFNREGDLFATDQEGATWVPNGNPLDELLHIQGERHYGFPPRHPEHLPGVIDEPSTFDYAPQHQSTCGLNFNDPVEDGGPTFGPDAWAGDALVAGYARGKLYRTQLVKSAAGYVARTHLLACLRMLTVDACVSPGGDLVIACHSGGPDWGSGPGGIGKLFKVSYADRECAQPVLAWVAGPRDLRIEFDRPLDPNQLRDVVSQSKLTSGSYVRAGDRFETLAPGYAAVQAQKLAPRRNVALHSAQLTPDGRTLVIAADPMAEAVHYGLELPRTPRPSAEGGGAELPQHDAIDLDFDLTGCEAAWLPADGGPAWTGWLPHYDLSVSRRLTAGSASHDALWAAMQAAGELRLRGQLDLADMLRPAVQPGSQIDYDYPPESPTVKFHAPAGADLRLTSSADAAEVHVAHTGNADGGAVAALSISADGVKLVPIELALKTPGGEFPQLAVSWHTNEDARPRPLAVRRLLLSWARVGGEPPSGIDNRDLPELAGGNWLRGKREFFGSQAACSNCHQVRGEGGALGPDLSNLTQRDYASVSRDIAQPSFAINPDHLSQIVLLATGQVLTGLVRTEGDALIVTGQDARETSVPRAEVESISTATVSLMPGGIPELLGPERMRDLLTFLLVEPPRMPDYGEAEPPPARPLSEVQALLAGADDPGTLRSLNIVLVSGPKDHGPGEHDYPAWVRTWQSLLGMAENVEAASAEAWPSEEQFRRADVMVFYQQGAWTPERARDVDRYLRRGGGLAYIHYAVDGRDDPAGFAQRIGLAWRGGQSKFRHGALDVQFAKTGANHPISRNMQGLDLVDESYWNLVGDRGRVDVLATGREDDEPQPLFWTREQEGGRIFVSIPGHFAWTFDDPAFRILLLRGIAWAAKEPVDRFNDLVLPGARVDADR